jgi:hypothetical protein
MIKSLVRPLLGEWSSETYSIFGKKLIMTCKTIFLNIFQANAHLPGVADPHSFCAVPDLDPV